MKDNVRSRKKFLFGVSIVLVFALGSAGSGYATYTPPVCDADGPYSGECEVQLDGTGSYDPYGT